MHLFRFGLSHLLFGFLLATWPAQAEVRPNTLGFYPIWETTALTERNDDLYLGTSSVHVGIADNVQAGLQPMYFMYRTPNAYAKWAFFETERWSVAGQLAFFHLMESASRAFVSPMYTSRLDNPDFAVNMMPLSLAASARISPRVTIHQTVSAAAIFSSGPLKDEVTFGYGVAAELTAKQRHSVLFHAAEVGFWNHDFHMLGASYRYQNSWVEFRFGYFYRMRPDSGQSSPMISLGVPL